MRDQSDSSALAFRAYVFLTVMTLLNVPSRVPFLGVFRPTLVLVTLIGLVIFLSGANKGQKDVSSTTRLVNALVVCTLLSAPFVEWPGSVVKHGVDVFVRSIVFFYFTVYLVDTIPRLRFFISAVIGCQVFRVLEPLYLHVTTGYWGSAAHIGGGEMMARLAGAPSDIVNPNGLAFVVLTAIPFLHYFLGECSRAISKMLYLISLFLLVYALLLTGSRSGMIGLAVVALTIIWRSEKKSVAIPVAVVGVVLILSQMNADLQDRYLSIFSSDTRNGPTSSGRMDGVVQDALVGMRRPIVGHGLGTSREALANFTGRDQPSHNLYTEVFIELGVVGLFIYLLFLRSVLRNVVTVLASVSRAIEDRRQSPDDFGLKEIVFLKKCANGTMVWVVMCLVFSFASYGLSEFYWYLIAGFSVAIGGVMVRYEGIFLSHDDVGRASMPTGGHAT